MPDAAILNGTKRHPGTRHGKSCAMSPCDKSKEPLNQSAAALSGSFIPAYRFENLEIRKGFLRFPSLNLEQNPSLTTLAI